MKALPTFRGSALLLGLCAALGLLPACASLSKGQMKAIQSFSQRTDSLTVYPSAVLEGLARLRAARGVYFAASLQDPQRQVDELEALHKAGLSDASYAKKINAPVEALAAYARALKSLSHENRYKNLGLELRNLGRDLDSTLIYYNRSGWGRSLPEGILKLGGKVASYAMESHQRHRQTRALKAFVAEGDSLVALCCQDIVDALKGPELEALLANEREGLEANYLSYLRQEPAKVSLADHRAYLDCLAAWDEVKSLRSSSATACRNIRKAHAGLLEALAKGKPFTEFYAQCLLLYQDAEDLYKQVGKLQDKLK